MLFLCVFFHLAGAIDEEHEINYRKYRNCKHKAYDGLEPFYRRSVFENVYYLVFIVLLGILFGLMFLGFLKGLIGILISKNFGEYGMNMLIDLPRPLDHYQEATLRPRPVSYDVAGWPVHPDTGERTVRILPTKLLFCLNVIFFLAYPLAIILKICSFCCCIRDYKGEDDGCFKEVNVIKCKEKRDPDPYNKGPKVDRYGENDLREAKDTHYVVQCMKQSQLSLLQLRSEM